MSWFWLRSPCPQYCTSALVHTCSYKFVPLHPSITLAHVPRYPEFQFWLGQFLTIILCYIRSYQLNSVSRTLGTVPTLYVILSFLTSLLDGKNYSLSLLCPYFPPPLSLHCSYSFLLLQPQWSIDSLFHCLLFFNFPYRKVICSAACISRRILEVIETLRMESGWEQTRDIDKKRFVRRWNAHWLESFHIEMLSIKTINK